LFHDFFCCKFIVLNFKDIMNKITLLILFALSILISNKSNTSTNFSSTGIIADLRYMDASVISGSNQINAINGYSFLTEDVGKLIAIKKGHHNPSTSAEIPFTTPGRIVTITAQIISVATDGSSATINGISLISSGGEITLNQNGIIGINPFYDCNYVETVNKALVFPNNTSVTIRNTNNARIKLCTETIDWDYKFALFASQTSNHNITIDIPCVPPDEATTRWGGNCSFFTTTLFSADGAENSVRNIELKNTASELEMGVFINLEVVLK